MPLIHSDLAEADAAEQAVARRVLNKDTRDELPETGGARGVDQGEHGHAAGTAPARLARGVDRELGDAGVAVARAVVRGRGEGEHAAVVLDHDDGVAAVEPSLD